ncbi:T9SS type A sorting domain-containing protein [Aequorivita marina]|uniref:T9SS type A sorting domain-containing protein n=1 Tax=Aequorivita marina TaxID=3073654 RepID=UPI0028744B6A|nr:T9SS type A sorting domain-containing protein [Aequorivita sp. S2608]MDS1298254.1 T9SS type A sorting domain-containing protein [Aequorivita sp. S2608]
MKLKLLFLALIGSIAVANAQYTVTDNNGNVLQEGDVLEYGTYGYNTGADYIFFVTNDNPSETIYSRLEFVSATNADGSMFEICYAGQCYTGVDVGFTAPPSPNVLPIEAGETTPGGDHILNGDPGDGTNMIEYELAFHQYEADGVTEIGTPLTFTYRYNPTLGVTDNTTINLTLESTVVRDELVVNVNEPVSLMVYNLQGRVVKQANFETGRQTLNMSNLNPQSYILQFNNEKGATQTTRIVVK